MAILEVAEKIDGALQMPGGLLRTTTFQIGEAQEAEGSCTVEGVGRSLQATLAGFDAQLGFAHEGLNGARCPVRVARQARTCQLRADLAGLGLLGQGQLESSDQCVVETQDPVSEPEPVALARPLEQSDGSGTVRDDLLRPPKPYAGESENVVGLAHGRAVASLLGRLQGLAGVSLRAIVVADETPDEARLEVNEPGETWLRHPLEALFLGRDQLEDLREAAEVREGAAQPQDDMQGQPILRLWREIRHARQSRLQCCDRLRVSVPGRRLVRRAGQVLDGLGCLA